MADETKVAVILSLAVAYLLYRAWPRNQTKMYTAATLKKEETVNKVRGVSRPQQYQQLPRVDTRRDGLAVST